MSKAKKKIKQKTQEAERLLLPEEAAEILRCNVGTMANWRSQGKGPHYIRMGSLIRYKASDLHDFVNSNYETPF